jgi:tetratricopeptide (TPR) repeat protein
MDLLDFSGEEMYFDEPLGPEVEALIQQASERYGEAEAEHSLLRAYFLEPEHLTVLVALYRYFYYRHQYAEALLVADRAIRVAALRLGLTPEWRMLAKKELGGAVMQSMALTRFLLLALKGSGYLLMRLGNAGAALERFEQVAAMDSSDRLGVTELLAIARSKVAQERVAGAGNNVAWLTR